MTTDPPAPAPGAHRRLLAAVVALTVGTSLPVFLVGALEVEMRHSLDINLPRFGIALALYYLTASTVSMPAGRWTERFGGHRTLRACGFLSAAALVAVAAGVHDWTELLPAMVAAGVASSFAQPAANLLLAEMFPSEHQGMAFGVKQSAVPLAALLGGSSVPAIALSVGWRWAFGMGAVVACVSALALPVSGGRPTLTRAAARTAGSHTPGTPLILLSVGFFFAFVAASSLTGFVVVSGVSVGGLGRGAAGLVAAAGGGAAVLVRLCLGWFADRRLHRPFVLIAIMLLVGTLGYAGLSLASALRAPLVFALAAALTYAVGWGWNGLFNFAVVRSYRNEPAWATGITQAGGRMGSVVGPLIFSAIVTQSSYSWAWLLSATAAVVSATLMFAGWRLLSSGSGSVAVQAG